MLNIPTQTENPKGLHARYYIQKVVPVPQEFMGLPADDKFELKPVDENAEYFVMRLDTGGSDIEHIKACRIGIHAYADAIQHHLPELTSDLKKRYPLLTDIMPAEHPIPASHVASGYTIEQVAEAWEAAEIRQAYIETENKDFFYGAGENKYPIPPDKQTYLSSIKPVAEGWVSVQDALPESNVPVLVALGKNFDVNIALRLDSNNYEWTKYHGGGNFAKWESVTHWQPLPPPPPTIMPNVETSGISLTQINHEKT